MGVALSERDSVQSARNNSAERQLLSAPLSPYLVPERLFRRHIADNKPIGIGLRHVLG